MELKCFLQENIQERLNVHQITPARSETLKIYMNEQETHTTTMTTTRNSEKTHNWKVWWKYSYKENEISTQNWEKLDKTWKNISNGTGLVNI